MKRVPTITISFLLLFGLLAGATGVHAQTAPAPAPVKKVPSIQVLMIQADDVKLPAEFQISLYENLIQQLQKRGGFEHIYRDGDKRATGDVVVLHSTVRGFKKGSEMARQVTTVAGKTSIDVHCQYTDKDGATVLEHDLNGKVMFFGGNMRATLDFAKKAAKLTRENFAVKSGS